MRGIESGIFARFSAWMLWNVSPMCATRLQRFDANLVAPPGEMENLVTGALKDLTAQ